MQGSPYRCISGRGENAPSPVTAACNAGLFLIAGSHAETDNQKCAGTDNQQAANDIKQGSPHAAGCRERGTLVVGHSQGHGTGWGIADVYKRQDLF